jgi:hypothetical protein
MTSTLNTADPTMAPIPSSKSPWSSVARTADANSGIEEPTATTSAPWNTPGSP